jgi:Flp pilus assembly protein TadD
MSDLEGKLGRNDQARAAYGEALALFKQIDDVLARLGFLVSRENPQLAARYFFESAQLYEMIGMIEERDAALIEADKLYK